MLLLLNAGQDRSRDGRDEGGSVDCRRTSRGRASRQAAANGTVRVLETGRQAQVRQPGERRQVERVDGGDEGNKGDGQPHGRELGEE